jgi:hypothetical protein
MVSAPCSTNSTWIPWCRASILGHSGISTSQVMMKTRCQQRSNTFGSVGAQGGFKVTVAHSTGACRNIKEWEGVYSSTDSFRRQIGWVGWQASAPSRKRLCQTTVPGGRSSRQEALCPPRGESRADYRSYGVCSASGFARTWRQVCAAGRTEQRVA